MNSLMTTMDVSCGLDIIGNCSRNILFIVLVKFIKSRKTVLSDCRRSVDCGRSVTDCGRSVGDG